MSFDTRHIIKKDEVAASRAVRPDPTVLRSSLTIPAEHVRVAAPEVEQEQTYSLDRLLRGDMAEVAHESFEVFTRHADRIPPPKPPRGAEAPDEEDEETVADVEARWARRLEEEVTAAREAAYEAGRASIRAESEETIRELRAGFARDLDAVRAAWEGHLHASRVHLVDLAFRIARAVLDAPLPDGIRRLSETAIADAVERMADGVPVEIFVHPVSYLRLQEAGLDEQLSAVHGKLIWRSDPDLKENEWIVQTSRSVMRRMESELLGELQRELSMRDAGRKIEARSDEQDPEAAE